MGGNSETGHYAQFMAEIKAAHRLNCRSYSNLHAFSIRGTDAFWAKA